MVCCPTCGVPGIELGDGVWKCWGCVVTLKRDVPPPDDACRCQCGACQTLCEYIEDEDADSLADQLSELARRLPSGFSVPRAPERWNEPVRLALLYRADGALLTEGASPTPAMAERTLV